MHIYIYTYIHTYIQVFEKYIAQVVLETNHQFAVGYSMPACSDLNAFRSSIEAFPVIERPEVTGLSSTSEFIFGLQHAEDVFSKLANTLVGAGSSPDMVSEVQLLSRVEELLQKFPMPVGASEVREALEKDGGANLPTNVAFKHELDVFGKVLTTARHSLQRMHVMLTGNLTPSEELNEAVQDIQLHRSVGMGVQVACAFACVLFVRTPPGFGFFDCLPLHFLLSTFFTAGCQHYGRNCHGSRQILVYVCGWVYVCVGIYQYI